jgi:parallel beta-helix repeat protein
VGGVCFKNSSGAIALNDITGNYATIGGGICVLGEGESQIQIYGNTVSNNVEGGGIYLRDNTSPNVHDNLVSGNESSLSGAGIYVGNGSSPAIKKNTLSGNISHGDGGGIYSCGSSPSITENLIAGNEAGSQGGGDPVLFFLWHNSGQRDL